MINDRGAKKWTSIMLPEHVKLLSAWTEEQKLVEKPVLDEQELERIRILVMDSLNYTLPIRVVYWKDGLFTKRTGIVAKVDELNKLIKLDLLSGETFIPIDSIKSVRI
ncbi:YolD-like family protein [Peribacillus cavernae]|uniref:YolD-like family protein n=1 Tax=Peribacillus cavernae TaxID=1674310 RepID=A0A3S0VI17_9BACI|nr:YolD-like family protein [Peribacillus cavernae]MDQ0220715.1 hypothetical protein [Peribacillus cavernae]RUQ32430.1 YolD-like family protein [Peribacillus cavernae]